MSNENSMFGVHAAALALRSQRMTLLASNIANASTPGYKARDIDFNRALEMARGGHTVADAALNSAGYRIPTSAAMDGNTVDVSTEQTLFAENALQYRTTLTFLEGRISTLRRALKGE